MGNGCVNRNLCFSYNSYGATKASRDQAAEMRRQYEEDNRPYITVELIYERKAYYGLRFSNHGKRLANHVRIQLDQTFLDSLKEPSFREMLKRANGKECIIGIGQHYDLYFGSNKFRENTDKYPLSGQVVYQDGERTYKEAFNIDFDSYATFFSVNCDFDDFLKEMKAQTRELHGVGEKLQQLVTVCQVSADNTDSKSE